MSFFLKSIHAYTHKCIVFMSNALRNQKMQAQPKTIHLGLYTNLNYIIQYCISNQNYTKVVTMVIVINDLSMQEISNVFL